MEHNLAAPWGDGCSGPLTPFLSFSSPQSENLLFERGAQIDLHCRAALRSVALRWTLHRNLLAKPFREGVAEALPGNRFRVRLATAGLHPGFYDLRVVLDTGAAGTGNTPLTRRPVNGVCTFGWQAAQMAVAETRPADFRAFWDRAKAALDKVALDAREEPLQTFTRAEIDDYNVKSACLPPEFDPEGRRYERVESGKVDFAGPDGGRVYGWLAKPEGRGPFPAMLVLPGAGFNARPRPLDHARHGYVALDIQVHGQPVDLPRYETLPGYYDQPVHEPVEAYYFHRVHLRCLQAVRYLASRPDVDPTRIVVVGGSQGGRLAFVVGALEPRVRAIVPAIANAPNQPYLRWAARCNGYAHLGDPKRDPNLPLSDGMDVAGAPPLCDDAAARCMAYYDPLNFAPDVRCPVFANVGLIDPVSPPVSVCPTFARLGSTDKTLVVLDGLGHDWSAEFDRQAYRWLDRVLAKP
jgi:cephalosporin-C deacetylase-like acetyl esterase